MRKENKSVNNFPNLRFPGFEREWEVKKLGDIMDFKVTNSLSRENLNYEAGTVKNIHYGDIHTKFQTLFDVQQELVPYINEEVSLNRIPEDFYCQEGDIVFADASEDLNDVGKSIEILHLRGEKVLAGLHTLLARPLAAYFYKGFNGFMFTSDNVRNQIKKEAQGSKVLSINVGRISKIELSIPSIEEQYKITVLLSLIHKRIATQKKIIEDLIVIKDLVGKKIFLQTLRHKNNKGFTKWKEKKLGDITSIVNTRNKTNEKLPVYSINNKLGFVPQNEQFEGVDSCERGYDIKLYKIITKNMFAYNPARINVGSIGYSGDLDNIIISSLYVCFQSTSEINDDFLYQYFKTDTFKQQVLKNVEGGVRDYLFYENFSRIKVAIPDIEEQTTIAKTLAAIDAKTNLEKDVLLKYENQKKYLLANLFI